MMRKQAIWIMTALAVIALAEPATPAPADERIEVKRLDDVVRSNPLAPGVPAAIVDSMRAGGAEIGVLVMSKNRLHHHVAQDHVLYLVRGRGIARLETAAGQLETREIKPGDMLGLPRGRKHGFEKIGDEDLVFLVVGTPLPPGAEETTYHE